jgi:hypothetical protein
MSPLSSSNTTLDHSSQTFGITSGTLECEKAASLMAMEKLNSFVGDNMDNLAMDISKGSGEYLTTLAVLLDIPIEERADLYNLLQANFSNIYTSRDVTHIEVLNNLELILAAG